MTDIKLVYISGFTAAVWLETLATYLRTDVCFDNSCDLRMSDLCLNFNGTHTDNYIYMHGAICVI